jgi:MFS family permease
MSLARILPSVLALLSGFALIQMGNALQTTLLSIRGDMEGFSDTEIGALGAGFWLGVVLGSVACGTLIRRVGHVRTFATLGTIASTAPLVHLTMLGPGAWIATRALTGFCFAGMFMVVESWLSGAATDQTRGRILGLYSMTGLFAGICGQLILPLSGAAGFLPFCIVATIISYALVPMLLTRASAPAISPEDSRVDLRWLCRQSPFGVVAGCLGGVTTASFYTLGPVFAQRRGLGTNDIALLMASGSLGGFLTAWPLGWLSDRLDRRLVLIGAALVAAISLFAMAVLVPATASSLLLNLCAFIFGGAVVPTYSLALAHVNDTISREEVVAAAGGLLLVYGLGAAIGPLVSGVAMSVLEHGLAIVLVGAQFLIGAYGVIRLLQRSSPTAQQKPRYIVEPPIPVGTALAPARQGPDRRRPIPG